MTLTTFAMVLFPPWFLFEDRTSGGERFYSVAVANRCKAGTIRTRPELTQAADCPRPAIKLPRRQNGKRYRDCRACAAKQDRPSKCVIAFVDRPLRPGGQNLRCRAFSLRQKQVCRHRGRRCRSRRRSDRENSGKEFCSCDSARTDTPISLRARRDGDVQA